MSDQIVVMGEAGSIHKLVSKDQIRKTLIGAAHNYDAVPPGDDTWDEWVDGHLDEFVHAVWRVLTK